MVYWFVLNSIYSTDFRLSKFIGILLHAADVLFLAFGVLLEQSWALNSSPFLLATIHQSQYADQKIS